MTEYLVTFAASAKKELRDLPADIVARVIPRIRELSTNPRPVGSKNCAVIGIAGEFVSGTIASFMRSTTSQGSLTLLGSLIEGTCMTDDSNHGCRSRHLFQASPRREGAATVRTLITVDLDPHS